MLNRALDHLEEWLIATLIAAATGLIFVAVVHRYGAGESIALSRWATAHGLTWLAALSKAVFTFLSELDLSWAQELCIYMFIWMAKFGAAYGVRTGIHVGVDLLVNRLPEYSRKQVILFALLCGAIFTGMIAAFGASFVGEMFHTGQQSNDLEAPMWIVYLAIPLGSGLMCFRFLQVAWSYYRTGELPHHDETHVEGVETGVSPALHPQPAGAATKAASRKISPLGVILILAPILIFMLCLAEKSGVLVLPHWMRAATVFALLIALMLTGIPVSIALGLTVMTFLFTLTTVPIEAVSMKLFTGIESFEIMAIPFFILAGNFLTHGGVARRMINFATSLIGHWHGGLGLAGIVACAMFALVCGSSVATVAAIGAIVLPEMVRHGYPMRFGAGIITVAGSLGILMLPSIPKIVYAVSTNTSIGALFVAGLLPGMLLTTMLCIVTWWLARNRDYPRLPKASWSETVRTFRESIWGLMLVVIIIGGIYSGLFTATEAAAMAAVYSFFISVFVYKAIGLKDVPRVLLRAANTSAMLLYIVTNAVLFSFVLSNENLPATLADWITAQNLGWVGFLALVNVLLLLAGNFMEPNSIILIMAPILAPAAKKLGIDLVHFGIVIDVNMEVGLCHPPVGLNLYVASMIARMRITDLAGAVMPWLITMLGFLIVVTYWPELTLWLPRVLGMM
ncbi:MULTISPECIES: TRAP transporter large permease subunit [unclassified Bradyrhizobium]|uniref:TRAP transporter large permease n=1 Tax=unclassified Bradyrhizobium TaxID=2631580 RepID=UPI00247AF40B|nr:MULTISPECIES: TRAP transporter large permease subunit [unclassified Bradyrhizobium]WGR75198.1 TRAP transporter large permease subunit [Bradyrhizobium sp. ISRA426]WGR82700.1 TRAP transporter large permease subunit [Bradyrhizobium sp. ISRA430]WGR90398.1 TRAP transporter large permease subunit [Bradyrhizobium sp. ISRA432]